MKSKGKYIGLNQRVPFDVLDSAIHFHLENGVVDKEYILEKMLTFTKGENRAKKASSYVIQIFKRQVKIISQLKKALSGNAYANLKVNDRKALCLCLISLSYPITYDLLIALAQGFKVQKQINKKFISEKVMSIYGSNRTVDVAIDALLPMIIELQTIKRDKVSLYSIEPKIGITNRFIAELIIYTDIKLSGSKSILIDDLNYKPWFSFFEISGFEVMNFNQLLTRKDSAVGKGYLTI